MSNDLKAELSAKNKYRIERHRYYELKHFCLQYQHWKDMLQNIDGYGYIPAYIVPKAADGRVSDPTERAAEAREIFTNRIEAVETAARETDPYFSDYILKAVTNGWNYNYLHMVLRIPCCRGTYYELYRRFFYLLDKVRK